MYDEKITTVHVPYRTFLVNKLLQQCVRIYVYHFRATSHIRQTMRPLRKHTLDFLLNFFKFLATTLAWMRAIGILFLAGLVVVICYKGCTGVSDEKKLKAESEARDYALMTAERTNTSTDKPPATLPVITARDRCASDEKQPKPEPTDAEFAKFIHAVDIGDVAEIQRYAGAGFSVDKCVKNAEAPNFMNMEGRTAISRAANSGKIIVLEKLIAAGAAIDSEALSPAAANPQSAALKLLLSHKTKVSVNDLTDAAAYAASNGRIENLKILLDAGADPNLVSDGALPLISAINWKHADCVRLLLNRGANPNIRDPASDVTPLFAAITEGQLEIVKMLAEHGADLNQSSGGGAPYQHALSQGETKIAKFLKSKESGVPAGRSGHYGTTTSTNLGPPALRANYIMCTSKEALDRGVQLIIANKRELLSTVGCAPTDSTLGATVLARGLVTSNVLVTGRNGASASVWVPSEALAQ